MYSKWKYLGYSEENGSYLYTTKLRDWTNKQDYRELDEMQVYKYIAQHNIDFILDNVMCLNLHNKLTNNKLSFV